MGGRKNPPLTSMVRQPIGAASTYVGKTVFHGRPTNQPIKEPRWSDHVCMASPGENQTKGECVRVCEGVRVCVCTVCVAIPYVLMTSARVPADDHIFAKFS